MKECTFVLAKTKDGFEAALQAGTVTEGSLVFIQETKEIWTHGTVFPCPYSKEELDEMIEELTGTGTTLSEAIEAAVARIQDLEDGKVDKVSDHSLVADSEIEKLEGLKSQDETDTIISGINDAISDINGEIDNIGLSIDDINDAISDINSDMETDAQNLATHIADKTNPHAVTKAQVGLGNVENLAPADMPVSDATQTELDKKVDKETGKSLVDDTEIAKLAALKTEAEIEALITAEETRAKGVEATLTSGLADEVQARISGDSTLQGLIDGLTERLNTLADSDDETLDQLSEVVAYIKNNKSLIDGITTGKVSVDDIVDNLTSTEAKKPLSANQGKALKDLIDGLSSDLTTGLNKKVDKEDGKGLSTNDYTTAEKTKLTNIEEGAQVNTVTSVAGKTGAVTLAKADVGLGEVDNTSDKDKPISDATQEALDALEEKIGAVNEVEVGETTPSSDTVEIFIDTTVDPLVTIYTKEQIDNLLTPITSAEVTQLWQS